MLAELNAEHAKPSPPDTTTETNGDTEVRKDGDTDERESVRTEARKHGSTDGSTEEQPTTLVDTRAPYSATQPSETGGTDKDTATPSTIPNTRIRKSVDTEARTDGSTSARKHGRKEGRAAASTHGSTSVSTEARTEDFLEKIRAGLAKKDNPPGGVKTTTDMSLELNTRAKRYSLDHGNVSTRQILLVLLAEFLTEEGY